MRVLVVNAGSSSLKLRLLGPDDELERTADLTSDGAAIDQSELAATIKRWPRPDAVGHRIVHGGTEFTGPARLTAAVIGKLRDLTELAPLHQPKSLAALDAVTGLLPEVSAVGCFDTAFHAGMPAAAATYPVPQEWRDRYRIRRFGFHGLSHSYAAGRAAELIGQPLDRLRVVTCHLGAGASLCAVRAGHSVDTTMGFTPLEGLMMATRSGTVDPGLLLWLAEHERLAPHEIAEVLEHHSGMLALAGTADQREAERRARAGDPGAELALAVYLHRLAGGVAAMAAAAGGLDLLVFTGGVGEHSPLTRQRTAASLDWLGVRIDDGANHSATADTDLSAAGAPVRTVLVTAREDLQIARECRQLLGT